MNQEQLIARVEALEREVAALKSSHSIPLEIDRSFMDRGFLKTVSTESLDPLDYDSLNRVIALTGNPQDIEVLEWPFRWLKLGNGLSGIDLYVPVYGIQQL